MDQSENEGDDTSSIRPESETQRQGQGLASVDSSLPQLTHSRQPQPTQDSDMEGGEDTAGISPSPWDGVVFDGVTQPPPDTRHDYPATEMASGLTPTVVEVPVLPTDPPVTNNDSTVIVAPVVPPHDFRDPISDRHGDTSSQHHHNGDAGNNSGEDDDDDEEEEDDEERADIMHFYPFEEDNTPPHEDELRVLDASHEHSALDNKHWRERTFFDTKDPEILAGESGVIEWTVEAFNGTKENPRKDLLVKSPPVRIGNHSWRIKILPRGHISTDRVSVYVECVDLHSNSPQTWPEEQLPLPTIGNKKLSRQQAVTAQISVLMYNPGEPRVYEFRKDAHQFHKDSPDHGWSRFTNLPWHEIHRRNYMAREPLLRNDKLALKAFIRIVYDPTGCLWSHNDVISPQDPVLMTGLQTLPPFEDLAVGPVIALWTHLRPFRRVVYHLGAHDLLSTPSSLVSKPLAMLQAVLYRMRTRLQESQGSLCRLQIHDFCDHIYDTNKDSCDVMQAMDSLLGDLEEHLEVLAKGDDSTGLAARAAIEELKESMGSRELQFSGARKTKLSIANKQSMQEVVDGEREELASLGSPQLLTIELDRQVFDREQRCWKKLLNKVRLDDEISVDGTMYTLYGYACHAGYLQSGSYSSFFRPNGLGNLWYTYKSGRPECLTLSKAVSSREGSASAKALHEPIAQDDRPANYGSFDRLRGESEPIAYVVLYVRSDIASDTFYMSDSEPWEVPEWILDDYKTSTPADSIHSLDPIEAALKSDGTSRAPAMDASHHSVYTDNALDPTIGSLQDDDTNMDDVATTPAGAISAAHDRHETGEIAPSTSKGSIRYSIINYFSQPFYEGTMLEENYHGEGHLIELNGNEYTGGFAQGLQDGKGKMVYQNGDTYEGSWIKGKHDGQGTYTESRTGNVYEGNFEDGKKHGEGTTFWKVSEEQSRLCRICYEKDANAAFYSCGHVASCFDCASKVQDCPVCRQKIRDVLRLYYTA